MSNLITYRGTYRIPRHHQARTWRHAEDTQHQHDAWSAFCDSLMPWVPALWFVAIIVTGLVILTNVLVGVRS